jgi:alpha-tubulin suppressor-like RCC1 family protein
MVSIRFISIVLCCFPFNIFLLILGKLGLGDAQLNRLIPTSVEALKEKNIIRIASMSTYCLALSSSGTVYIWGVGGSVGTMPSSKTDITPQIFDALPLRMKIMDISCGLGHALFLTNFGRVFSWGSGGNGRLGVGDTIDRTEACLVTGLCSELIVSVTCGASHSLAITSKGQIYSWGKNSQGQNGIGNVEDTLKPVLVKKLAEKFVIQVAAGWEHTLALTNDGKMYSWGCGYKDNKRGTVPPVLGLGNSECKASPELITSIETIRIIVVACGWDHCLALDSDGKVLSWGSGQNGEFNVSFLFVILLLFCFKGKLGHGNEENISVPCYIPDIEDTPFVKIAAGCEHSAGITASGDLFAWGHGDGGRLGLGTNIQSFTPVKVEPLQQMKIRPISLHCGDKFTSIIGYPWDENLEAEKERMASSGNEKWELKRLQEWLIAEKENKNNNQEEAERKEVKEEDSKATNSFSDLQDCFRWIDSVDEQTICENEESVILVLLSIIQADANHLLDPFQTNSSVIAASNAYLQDKEFSLEVCEDNFSNLHNLLELLTPLYSDHLNSYINKTFSKSINDQKTWKSLDWILLQIYLVLSNNLSAVSNIVKASKEKKLQKQIKDGKTTEETKSEEQQKEDYLLSFIYRRDNKVSNISPGKQMTSSGKFRSGDYSATRSAGRRSGVEDEENSRHSSSMYGDDENNNDDDDEGGHNNNDDGSQSNYHNSDYNTTEGEGLASRDNAPSPAPSYESMENSLSGKRKSREEPTNRNMATTTTGAIAGEGVGDDGNYSVQSSLQESDYFDENHSQNDNNENGEHLLGENDDEEEHADPEGDVELQRALLSSIDSSRNLISSNYFTQSNLNLLKSIDKRRGKVSYLPKIRNMLNVISSLSFICIQQYYENYPQSDYSDDSSMKENIFRIYLTWESTQLVTAAGFDCMYDETEQKSVLLQIIRSPESFLYIIPGVMKGLQKDSNNFEDVVDNLFPETFVSFFSDNNEDQQPQQQLDESQNSFESPRNEELENEVAIPSPQRNQNNNDEMNGPEETISSSHLSIEDIIKILENLLNLYERKQFKLSLWKQEIATDSNDIISRLYDQVQDSFSQLASRIISTPIQWFLKLGNNELSAFVTVNDAFASSEPWGTKMETVLLCC